MDSLLNVIVIVASVLGTAFGTYYISRKQAGRDYSHELSAVLQALEISNRQLREDLDRKDAELKRVLLHRDQLMVENIEYAKRLLERRNGAPPR